MTSNKQGLIRNIYLYVVSAISLFMIVFSIVSLINVGLKTWVFTEADRFDTYPMSPEEGCYMDKSNVRVCPSPEDRKKIEEERKIAAEKNQRANRQRELVQNISFLIVAAPLFAYHWMLIRRDRREEE